MNAVRTIAVAGAGVMGSGIALAAAQNGFSVILFDVFENTLKKGMIFCETTLSKLVEKEKITEAERTEILKRIRPTGEESDLVADLIIEAVPEKLELKRELFSRLEQLNGGKAILASNTSTLPITRIASGLEHPGKVIGMHFFNPATIMKLVEVIPGESTSDETIRLVVDAAERMGKTVAQVKDEPGFIVNRVARHFYLESLRVLEENVASNESIDRLLEASGFKMGAFKLMDLIGVETNHSVTQSLYESMFQDHRFRPSRIQQKKVDAGHFGRKTGKGFYNYDKKA